MSMYLSTISIDQGECCTSNRVRTLLSFSRFHDFFHYLRFRSRCLSTPLLSYTVLAFSSEVFREVANLSHKTLIFHGFQGPTIKFHDPQAWKMKFLNSIAFQVFQHTWM